MNRQPLTQFNDYAEMMADQGRLDAYRTAIERTVKPGDIVIDLGAGLGLLSFLAVECGAARVYAIEHSDSIILARAVAEQNELADKIVFLNQNSRDVQLGEKADVLISETLGSFGLDENTLAFTADVRDRLLKPGARLLPQHIRPWLCPVETEADYAKLAFWQEIAGFDFTPALTEMLSQMNVIRLAEEQLLAEPQCLGSFDLSEVSFGYVEQQLQFEMNRPGTIHGLAGWFEVDLCEGISLSTSPSAPPTHWKQAFFPNRKIIEVLKGDSLNVTFGVGPRDALSDEVKITCDYHFTEQGEVLPR